MERIWNLFLFVPSARPAFSSATCLDRERGKILHEQTSEATSLTCRCVSKPRAPNGWCCVLFDLVSLCLSTQQVAETSEQLT